MTIDLSSNLTQEHFGQLVGINQSAVSALVTSGVLSRDDSAGAWILAYCARLREQAAGRLGTGLGGLDLVQERAALAREQRAGIEIKNAVLRGEYAPIDLLAQVLATASQSVIDNFDQLPGQIKKACPNLPDAAREQVMTTIALARNEWARATEALVLAKVEADLGDDSEAVDA